MFLLSILICLGCVFLVMLDLIKGFERKMPLWGYTNIEVFYQNLDAITDKFQPPIVKKRH